MGSEMCIRDRLLNALQGAITAVGSSVQKSKHLKTPKDPQTGKRSGIKKATEMHLSPTIGSGSDCKHASGNPRTEAAARCSRIANVRTSCVPFGKLIESQSPPAICVALIIRTVEAFLAFDLIYVITNGGPANGTVTISYLTYLEMFTFGHAGRGSALSFLISLVTLTLAFIYIRMLYRPAEKQ